MNTKQVESYPNTAVKCPVCDKKFNRNMTDFVSKSNRYYHKECYDKMESEMNERKEARKAKAESEPKPKTKSKPKASTKKATKEVDKDYAVLIEYICKLRGDSRPTMLILTQVKRYKEFGYTYNGMLRSLEYFHVIKGNPVLKDKGVGIIESIYDEAKNYYSKRYDLLVENSKIEFKDETETYKKSSSELRAKHKAHFIDLEEIEW